MEDALFMTEFVRDLITSDYGGREKKATSLSQLLLLVLAAPDPAEARRVVESIVAEAHRIAK